MLDKPLPLFLLVLLGSMLGSFLANLAQPKARPEAPARVISAPAVPVAPVERPPETPSAPKPAFVASYERQRLLGEDIHAALGMAKVAMAEYYMSQGSWPGSNEQLGIPAPQNYRGHALTSLQVFDTASDDDPQRRENGLLLLFSSERLGIKQARVEFIAEATPEMAMGIRWRCRSPDLQDIATIVPDCLYSPKGRTALSQ